MPDTSTDTSAYIHGLSWTLRNVRHSYTHGATPATPDNTPAYMYGGTSPTSSQSAYCQGPQIDKKSRKPAYMFCISKAYTHAYLSGPT